MWEMTLPLGEVGRGFKYTQVRLGPARLTHCMRWLALARRALDIALARAEGREVFGAPLHSVGMGQNLIAESVIDIERSGAVITKIAAMLELDPKFGSAMPSVAKVHCSEAIFRVVDPSIQIWRGVGASDGLPLVQYLNEVRPFRCMACLNSGSRPTVPSGNFPDGDAAACEIALNGIVQPVPGSRHPCIDP
jgi:acyl-CoA dehydrogenase